MRTLPIAVVAGMLTISSPGFSQDQGLVGARSGQVLNRRRRRNPVPPPEETPTAPLRERRRNALASRVPWRPARWSHQTRPSRSVGAGWVSPSSTVTIPVRSKHGSHHAGPKLAIDRQWSAH